MAERAWYQRVGPGRRRRDSGRRALERWSRDEIGAVLEGAGARVTSSVSKQTDFVVVGGKPCDNPFSPMSIPMGKMEPIKITVPMNREKPSDRPM